MSFTDLWKIVRQRPGSLDRQPHESGSAPRENEEPDWRKKLRAEENKDLRSVLNLGRTPRASSWRPRGVSVAQHETWDLSGLVSSRQAPPHREAFLMSPGHAVAVSKIRGQYI